MPPIVASEYRVTVNEGVLDDLRDRLSRTRFATELGEGGWSRGTPRSYLEPLVRYWQDEYDWRRYENRLNSVPQQICSVDGQTIHFFHIRCESPSALPLLLVHDFGHWGGEYLDVIPLLASPAPDADRDGEGFHLVIPSLPGFAFSGPLLRRGLGPRWSARALGDIMESLGYGHYGLAGHGLGGLVAANVADVRPDAVTGLHLAAPPEMRARQAFEDKRLPDGTSWEDLSQREQDGVNADADWCRRHFGQRQTLTQVPQSIGVMLENSPAGMAAWAASHWRLVWGDEEKALMPDRLLDWVTTAWVTGSVTSAARLLYELDQAPRDNLPFGPISVATAVQQFPTGFPHTPRRWVERRYRVTRWTEEPEGGQFPAMEHPERLAADIKDFFQGLRGGPRVTG